MTQDNYVIPVMAEFVGMTLFQVLGGSAIQNAAFTNGLVLMVLLYTTSSLGAAHLNAWVTLSLLAAGHFKPLLAVLFIAAQAAGCIAGAALQLAIVPYGSVTNIGCFHGSNGISKGQLLVWEALMSYTFLTLIHNVCVWRKSFVSLGPLVIGATLAACASSGGYWTGGALNVNRVLGPAIVNSCWDPVIWCYILGQFAGTIFAIATSIAVNGFGTAFSPPSPCTPNLIRGSLAPGTVSSKAGAENESRLAPALDCIMEV